MPSLLDRIPPAPYNIFKNKGNFPGRNEIGWAKKKKRPAVSEEERQAQRAAARAERRAKRAAEQASQEAAVQNADPAANGAPRNGSPNAQNTAQKPHKKKKINKFRLAVISMGIVLVGLIALGVANAAGVRTPIDGTASDGEPEFFSTVKPTASAAPSESTSSATPAPTSDFDGALFIGDSMTTQLKNYVTDGAGSTTDLHDADFMTRSDYSWSEAQKELNGGSGGLWLDDTTAMTITEAIDHFSVRKLYIQLGKEDLTYNDVATVTAAAQDVISKLQTKYPNLEITVQAVTPMLEWIDYQNLSSSSIAQYNEAMQTYCTGKKNLKFLNIAAFCTEGYLPAEYCADPEGLCIHLNDEGCAIWADYLLGRKTPESSPSPSPTPDPNASANDSTTDGTDSTDGTDNTDNTDYTDNTGDTTDSGDNYTDNSGDYTDDGGDYTDGTGDDTAE